MYNQSVYKAICYSIYAHICQVVYFTSFGNLPSFSRLAIFVAI